MGKIASVVAGVVATLLATSAVAADWKLDVTTRLRAESRDHAYTFNRNVASVTDDSWWLTRLRVGAKADWAPNWTSYLQVQDSREFGSARAAVPFISGSEGDDPVDLRQAYLEHRTPEIACRVGRQVLAFGQERMVGESNWSNLARTFDAVRLTFPTAGDGLDVFLASVVKIQPGSQPGWHSNHASRNDLFGGIYSRFAPRATLKLEPYVLWRYSTKDLVYSAGAAGSSRPYDIPQKVVTMGVRAVGGPAEKLGGFDYDAESAVQEGEVRGRQTVAGVVLYPGPAWLNHAAWAAHAGAGYASRVGELPWRIYVEANRASGDRDPADGKSGSFFNLFPTNHRFYGGMDVFAWKNMREIAATGSTTVQRTKLRLEHHWFALDNVNDTWFRANATTAVRPLTPAGRQAPRRAGSEWDFVVTQPIGKQVSVEAGASYFSAGPYLVRTGGATDARFGYLQISFIR